MENTLVEAALVIRPLLDFVIAVVFLLWAYKLVLPLNLRSFLVNPQMSVVWWFVPIANIVMPYFVMLNLYIRSRGSQGGSHAVGIILIALWWVAMVLSPWISGLYLAIGCVWSLIPRKYNHPLSMFEAYSDVADVVAAPLEIVIVLVIDKGLSSRSTELESIKVL